MRNLKELSAQEKEALGEELVLKYAELSKQAQTQDIKDSDEARTFVDEVITRTIRMMGAAPRSQESQAKVASWSNTLQKFGIELCKISFSKPGDVSLRLAQLKLNEEEITQFIKGMEQAGEPGSALLTATSVTTSIVASVALAGGGLWYVATNGGSKEPDLNFGNSKSSGNSCFK